MAPLLAKHLSYRHEREVRLVTQRHREPGQSTQRRFVGDPPYFGHNKRPHPSDVMQALAVLDGGLTHRAADENPPFVGEHVQTDLGELVVAIVTAPGIATWQVDAVRTAVDWFRSSAPRLLSRG